MRCLKSISDEDLWRALKSCSVNIYLGPPDIITHDEDSNFFARSFQHNAYMLHIQCNKVPIEAASRMSLVESCHSRLQQSFSIIKEECPDLHFGDVLLAAVKFLNESTGPNGLIPVLLIFGYIPFLGIRHDPDHPTIAKRVTAVARATKEMSSYFFKRQVQDVIHQRNVPIVTYIRGALSGSYVMVYRERTHAGASPW